HPCLLQRENVRVPFDDDGALLLRDGGTCTVEPVEQVALAKELAFRRVDVFRAQRIVLVELACLEPEHASACVGKREKQTTGEVVVAAPIREACGSELLASETASERLARECRAAERKPEAVL